MQICIFQLWCHLGLVKNVIWTNQDMHKLLWAIELCNWKNFSVWNFLHAFLNILHAFGRILEHLHEFWNILYAFWNILEHSGKAGPRMVGGGQDFMDFMVDIKRDTIGAQYFLYRLWVHYKLTLALVIKLLSSSGSGPGQVQIFF